MKRLFSLLSISALVMTFVAQSAFAASLQAGEYVFINEQKNDDVYIAAGRVEINAPIGGDLYLTAGDAVISADINEDLVVAGGRVAVIGDVAGDIRVVGGEVAIFGNVQDDVVVIGGEVNIAPDSVIGGSVITGAGLLNVSGDVMENIHGATGALTLSGNVKGNVVVTVQDRLLIDHLASIGGNLEYSSLIEVDVPDNVVAGEIVFNQFDDRELLADVTEAFVIQRALSFLGALVLMIIFILAMPNMLTGAALRTRENILKSFGIGVLTIIVGIVSSIVLMMTLVGIPLALVMLFGLGLLMIFSKIFVAAYLGSYFVKYKQPRKKISRAKLFFVMLFTLFLYYLVTLIPIVGWIINLIFFSIGIGSILQAELAFMKVLKDKKLL